MNGSAADVGDGDTIVTENPSIDDDN